MIVWYIYHSEKYSFEINPETELYSCLLSRNYIFSDAKRYIILGSEAIDIQLKEVCVADLTQKLNQQGHHPSMIWVKEKGKIIYFVREYLSEYEKQLIIANILDSLE